MFLFFSSRQGCLVSLVVSMVEGSRFLEVFRLPLALNAFHWLGNMALGILGVADPTFTAVTPPEPPKDGVMLEVAGLFAENDEICVLNSVDTLRPSLETIGLQRHSVISVMW